ncbi:MAG: hypothetical protein HZB16_24645 [Armatimonadetes bacterium]|nr:hypothetical protein [Armatimonadota bacterium]
MSGGGTILTGFAFLLLFLVGLTRWHMAHGLGLLICGGIPVLVVAAGVVLLWFGASDLRAKKAEASK